MLVGPLTEALDRVVAERPPQSASGHTARWLFWWGEGDNDGLFFLRAMVDDAAGAMVDVREQATPLPDELLPAVVEPFLAGLRAGYATPLSLDILGAMPFDVVPVGLLRRAALSAEEVVAAIHDVGATARLRAEDDTSYLQQRHMPSLPTLGSDDLVRLGPVLSSLLKDDRDDLAERDLGIVEGVVAEGRRELLAWLLGIVSYEPPTSTDLECRNVTWSYVRTVRLLEPVSTALAAQHPDLAAAIATLRARGVMAEPSDEDVDHA